MKTLTLEVVRLGLFHWTIRVREPGLPCAVVDPSIDFDSDRIGSFWTLRGAKRMRDTIEHLIEWDNDKFITHTPSSAEK